MVDPDISCDFRLNNEGRPEKYELFFARMSEAHCIKFRNCC
jgi:hypothetical protein